MNTVRLSYNTDHVSCNIDAASLGYISDNEGQQFSPVAQLINTTTKVITYGRREI